MRKVAWLERLVLTLGAANMRGVGGASSSVHSQRSAALRSDVGEPALELISSSYWVCPFSDSASLDLAVR